MSDVLPSRAIDHETRHLRARNRKLTKPLRWQQKVREMDRIARDHQAAFKDL